MDVRDACPSAVCASVARIQIAVSVTYMRLRNERGVALMLHNLIKRSRFALALLVFCGLPLQPCPAASAQNASEQSTTAPTAAETAQWQQDLAAWRAQREKEVSAPEGWLSLAGLEWLKPGINSVGAAADNQIRLPRGTPEHLGLLTVNGMVSSEDPSIISIVQLLSPAAGFPPDLTIDGKPAREGALVVDNTKPSLIAWHGLSIVILRRGDRFVLRMKDADSPARTAFRGLNWYEPDASYRVKARWVPFKPAQVEEIPTVIGTTLKMPAPGLAVFLLNGQVMHLEPVLEDPAGKTLFFILRDDTSKTTTYGGGRFLHTGLPDHGLDQPGSLVLDFNQLENPPCAYTTYATCPLPPEQNRLSVAFPAGEQRYQR
jgi:uncharacterized protein (DUF1684 family)